MLMAETTNTVERTKEDALIDAGFRKRTNLENADVYKVSSILYGLVIFVGGVAFSISHAVVPGEEAEIIKHSAEIYFTCLYWISILWIIFCVIDIVHHRHKIKIPTIPSNRFSSNRIGLPGDVRFMPNKSLSISSEANRKSSNTPYISLPLFDNHIDDESDHDENERPEKASNEQSTDNINQSGSREDRGRSNSLDDLSRRSSTAKSPMDLTRDVSIRRRALDPIEKHDLINYVRHRKNSIVQHAIGYNYDDNSNVGGLYTRVGIGIFCLGTVIHASLSTLSSFENRPCARWTAIMDDVSRLLFSFAQFCFIFKHSNLIIRAHESAARFAVVHIVVTNLCVWLRMVVIETKSEIEEMNGNEMVSEQHMQIARHVQNNHEDTMSIIHRLLVPPSECYNLSADGRSTSRFIHEGYMTLKPLLYPCTIEFSLMCLTLFFLIWENIGKTFTHKISDKSSTKNIFMVDCNASNKGLFVGMIFFACTLMSVILYAAFRHKMGDTHHLTSSSSLVKMNHDQSSTLLTNTSLISHQQHSISSIKSAEISIANDSLTSLSITPTRVDYGIAILEIVNLCLLACSLFATIWSLIKIRQLNYRHIATRFDDVLILISLTGVYLYTIFSTFAIIHSLGSSTWVAYVKATVILLEFVEGTFHALFILIALRKHLKRTSKYTYPGREIITLLIMLDLSLWLEKTTTATKHEANPFQLAFYHVIPWAIIAAIATPLQIFFRFHASVCLSHVWSNMYHLQTYQLTSSS